MKGIKMCYIMQLYKKYIFFSLLLNFCFGLKVWSQSSTTFELNTEMKFQIIDGFGASDAWRTQFIGKNWPEAKKERIAELLFSQETDELGNPKGIGLSLWRFYIGAGSAEQGDKSDIENEWRRGESFIDEAGNYDWNKQEGQQWFLRKAKKAGVEKFLAFSIAAPVFWTYNNQGYAATQEGKMNLKPEFYNNYAQFMIKILAHFEDIGLGFDYISPINEPQWDWRKPTQEGTPATNENIATLIKLLDKDIKLKGLKTTIITPEAADLRFLYSEYNKPTRSNQIQEFFSEAPKNEVTHIRNLKSVNPIITGHSYFTTWPVSDLIEIRQKLNDTLEKYDLGYWQSEFCILEKSDDIGQGGKRDLGMPTALYVARVIHSDLALANARSWQWWTAITRADFKDGLIYIDTGDQQDLYNPNRLKFDGDFHDSKLLWAFGNYARFIRPGMQRVNITSETVKSLEEQYTDLMVSAYKNPENDNVVVVAINYEDVAKTIKIRSNGIDLINAFETSENQNLGRQIITDNTITLSPYSVTTLTTFSL